MWTSIRKPAYDSIVENAPAPASAVQIMIDFEAEHALTAPLIYVSTAITSGGFRRDPRFTDPADIRGAISKNNAACAALIAEITAQPNPLVTAANVMMPTELGAVPEWSDSDYLEFYVAWCAGLTGPASADFSQALADPELATIRAMADARDRTNDERWPAYLQFAKAATVEAALARRALGAGARPGSRYLLQLVDTGYSLGCRAEAMLARGLGWSLRGDAWDNMGDGWPETGAGHTGFTGTCLSVDPRSGLWAVLLTNAVHFGRGPEHSVVGLRKQVHAAVATELLA